jgi:hypothetical protein
MAESNAAAMGRLVAALKKHRPALARVILVDGEARDVSLEGGRQRWTPAARAIAAMPWVRVEFLDAKERLKAAIDNGGAATDVEDLALAERGTGGTAARELHLLKLMLSAQDVALQRQAELVKPAIEAIRLAMRDVFEQLTQSRKHARQQEEAASDLAEQLARIAARADEAGQGNLAAELGQLAGALPNILQAIDAGRKMLGGGGDPPKARPRPPEKPKTSPPPPAQPSTEAA